MENKMLKAIDVQKMLGIDDHVTIAHGYTFDRVTVDIYFDNGQLCLWKEVEESLYKDNIGIIKSDYFEGRWFIDGIKRLYKKYTNEKLVELFETFGTSLSLI